MKGTEALKSLGKYTMNIWEVWKHDITKSPEYKDIEKELKEYDLFITPNKEIENVLMNITKDGRFYFCGDAYYGECDKESLLKMIKDLIYYYKKM